jgi:hypothetical protein
VNTNSTIVSEQFSVEEFSEALDNESVLEKMDFERDHFWVPEQSNDTMSTSSSSVYEEPDDGTFSDDDIMAEIVKDRLLNGWTSEEDEEFDEFFELEEFVEPEIPLIVEPKKEPVVKKEVVQAQVKKQPVVKQEKTPVTPKVIKIEDRKKGQSSVFNSQVELTPKQITPNTSTTPSNPWLALAAMNMNSSFSPFPKTTVKPPATPDFSSQNLNAAATIASNLLKRPVNMNSVATAAAALMASPAAMKAFSELRKRELDKVMEAMNLQAKIKAAAQAAVAASQAGEERKVGL